MNIETLVKAALEEDIGTGDITTEACVDAGLMGAAEIRAKADLVVCGHAPAQEAFAQVRASYSACVADGQHVTAGDLVATVEGPLRSLLTAERVALNFLMRLSGIATHTRHCIANAGKLKVVDTRKTTPVHRLLEKHAVRMGGAHNHRFALYDAVLIKENHIRSAGSITSALDAAGAYAGDVDLIEIEVETIGELSEALEAGAHRIMLDNFSIAELREAVKVNDGRARLEASGNVTARTIRKIALTGVDFISCGDITKNVRAIDLSLQFDPPSRR